MRMFKIWRTKVSPPVLAKRLAPPKKHWERWISKDRASSPQMAEQSTRQVVYNAMCFTWNYSTIKFVIASMIPGTRDFVFGQRHYNVKPGYSEYKEAPHVMPGFGRLGMFLRQKLRPHCEHVFHEPCLGGPCPPYICLKICPIGAAATQPAEWYSISCSRRGLGGKL